MMQLLQPFSFCVSSEYCAPIMRANMNVTCDNINLLFITFSGVDIHHVPFLYFTCLDDWHPVSCLASNSSSVTL